MTRFLVLGLLALSLAACAAPAPTPTPTAAPKVTSTVVVTAAPTPAATGTPAATAAPAASPIGTPPPFALQDGNGTPCLTAGQIIPAGTTGRVAGLYVTAATGMDLRFVSNATGGRTGITMFVNATGDSGLLLAGLNEDSRFVAPGTNADAVGKAFDQVVALLRRAPATPIAACFP